MTRHRLGLLTIAATLSIACSAVQPSPSPTVSSATPGWPPFPAASAPDGVSLEISGEHAVLTNTSGTTYWLWPGRIEVWNPGPPWTEDPSTPDPVEVSEGERVELDITGLPTGTRVGARLWLDANHLGDHPAFVWVEIGASN